MYYTDNETTFEDISAMEHPETPRGWKVLIPTSDTDGNQFTHHACAGFKTREQGREWAKQTIESIKEQNTRRVECQKEIIGIPVFSYHS